MADGRRATAARDAALLSLLQTLRGRDYRFVTPTPATHAIVIARPDRREARSLSDVLGWSLPFRDGAIDEDVVALLREADALVPAKSGLWRSALRVSSLHGQLFLHSSFPTDAEDAVFFGPDSYRFADLIIAELSARPPSRSMRIVDVGAGAGVGAITAAKAYAAARITMTDINPKALRLASINAAAAEVVANYVQGDDLSEVDGAIDLALANPPYIVDAAGRDYRDGGALHGGQVALDMAEMVLSRLAAGGRLILYTGSAIVDGADPLRDRLAALAGDARCLLRYREIDPDVFGEELAGPAYRDVDRIALVAAIFTAYGS